MPSLLDPPKERTKTYHCTILSMALSPITHMSGVEGNEAVVMREPVACDGDVRWVPVLTGNALRHRMFRASGFRHLVNTWELRGSLSLAMLNFLFHGGNLTQSNGSVSLSRTNDVYRVFPLLRAVGASLPDQILPSNLNCDRGILVCHENRRRLYHLLPNALGMPDNLSPAATFVEGYQYTRNDAKSTAADLLPEYEKDDASGSNMMIFSGQQVIPGAAFLHGFTMRNVTTVELGAVLVALRQWVSDGATIGGMASKGHGRLSPAFYFQEEVDQAECVARYEEHLATHRAEGVKLLESIFAAKAEKPAKGKKAKKGDDDDETA